MKPKEFIRGAGILMPISSLPSAYGIGTLGYEAYRFVDTLGELRQRYWQVLPIGPTSYGDSPYQSFSAYAGNPYYIDLDVLVTEKLIKPGDVNSFNWGLREDDVDYGVIFKNRYKVLKIAFSNFKTDNSDFKAFCEKQKKWLDDYALFMAVKEYFGNGEWAAWDKDIRDRKPEAIQKYSEICKDEIGFWKFCQFEFYKQWHKLKDYANKQGIEIIGDIPLYMAYDSADVWADRSNYLLDLEGRPTLVAGCPPDAFSDLGQKWGNPLYNWDTMEQTGFSWWYERIKTNADLFDVIRIDHFIGFVRYYTIPAIDPDGRNGRWMKGPGKKLTEVIEAAAGKSKIIAEDLGVSVPGVRKLMQKMSWPGMKILIFAFDGNPDHEYLPHNYEDRNRVVYAGTHDNDTVVGYFKDKTEYELAFLYEYLGIKSKEEIPDALIRLAYSSVANVVIFQMQDILHLGNEARMNLPSTIGTNWRWRFEKEELTDERKSFIRTMATIYNR